LAADVVLLSFVHPSQKLHLPTCLHLWQHRSPITNHQFHFLRKHF